MLGNLPIFKVWIDNHTDYYTLATPEQTVEEGGCWCAGDPGFKTVEELVVWVPYHTVFLIEATTLTA